MPTIAQRMLSWMGMDEIPVIPQLACTDKVTIKLAQFEEWDEAVSQFVFHNDTNFEPIRFLVRDGDGSKSTLLIAQVEAGKGIVLYDQHGQEIFTASLPSHSAKALGEIKTANGFTAYVIERLCHGNLSVQKTVGTEDEKPIQVKRIKNRWCQLSSFFLGTWDPWQYQLEHDGIAFATLTPRGLSSTNSYALRFLSKAVVVPDQARSVAVGIALLFTLDKGFPPMKNLLRQSIIRSH